jgi:hypothetical protein
MINRQENLYKHYLKIKCLLHIKLYILEGMLTKQITFLSIENLICYVTHKFLILCNVFVLPGPLIVNDCFVCLFDGV